MSKVDGVIAALRVLSTQRYGGWVKSRELNRLISQLPGSRFGAIRKLKVRGDIEGEIRPEEFLRYVKSTLAYLEANRDAIAAMHWWSLRPSAAPSSAHTPSAPVDAEFTEVSSRARQVVKSKKGMRVIK